MEESKQTGLILVGGIPGTGTPAAVESLLDWITLHKPSISDQWGKALKFEDLLLGVYNSRTGESADNIVPLLEEPKPILREDWLDTVEKLREQIENETRGTPIKHLLVPIHLVWHHAKLREHISVLDAIELNERLQPFSIEAVLCFIDDIHDIYSRLRERNKLYDRRSRSFKTEQAQRGRAFWRHLRVLDWRSREVETAESIANKLGCPLSVLATKHQKSVAYHCLTKPNDQVYFSHPISEIRRLEQSDVESHPQWAEKVKGDIWDLQNELSRKEALLQPTCIDEYRISAEEGPVTLRSRFYPRDDYTNSLFEPLDHKDKDDVIYDGLSEEDRSNIAQTDNQIAQELARTVESFIGNQVTSRDFQLVTQARHLIVYRPRFNGHLSSGVKKELEYFARLQEDPLESERGGAILLDSRQDAEIFFTRQFLEGMVKESESDSWNLSLQRKELLNYLDEMTPENIELINKAAESSQKADIEDAINAAVNSIPKASINWQVNTTGKSKPLTNDGTFVGERKPKAEFIERFRRYLLPFEEREIYADHEKIWIDEKGLPDLISKIREVLDLG